MAQPRDDRDYEQESLEFRRTQFVTRDEWARFLVREYDPMQRRQEEAHKEGLKAIDGLWKGVNALNNKLWLLISGTALGVAIEVAKIMMAR
jgi:hypothetical protein